MNSGKITFTLILALALSAHAFGQGSWLDSSTVDNWNTGSMKVPTPPRYSADELSRCGHTIRPATLTADKVLTNVGWKVVGPAQVWGSTAVVQVAKDFDGQCRPLGYQYFVFSENKIVGTLSPKPMDSRTDGSLFQLELYNENSIQARYNRFKDTDAACCASGEAFVYFSISHEDGKLTLVPQNITSNFKSEEPGEGLPSLAGTKWRWVEFTSPVEDTAIADPDKFTLEFGDDGRVSAQVDCNKGTGNYSQSGANLTFSPLAVTRMACPGESLDAKFLNHLQWVRIVKIEGDNMYLDLFADGGTLKFEKVAN